MLLVSDWVKDANLPFWAFQRKTPGLPEVRCELFEALFGRQRIPVYLWSILGPTVPRISGWEHSFGEADSAVRKELDALDYRKRRNPDRPIQIVGGALDSPVPDSYTGQTGSTTNE